MKSIRVLVLMMFAMLLANTVWSAELVGYWSFDENQGTVAKTSAVSGYDGEIHGAKWVPGKVGSALEFNGSGDYVEVKDTAAKSPFALTSMSMSAWIKPTAYPAADPAYVAGIVGKGYYTESTYGLRLDCGGRAQFRVYGPFSESGKVGAFGYVGSKDKQITLGNWHHVAVTYDGANVKIYLDGRLDSVYKETRLPEINKQSIFIGSTSVKNRYFKGIIDEVKIYKGALTDAEVEEEYRKGGGTARITSGNLPRINEAPSVDGALSDLCWQNALKVDFMDNYTGKAPKAVTTGYMCYDDKNLYIAFDCKEPFMNRIKAKVMEKGGEVWNDDCVEAFIDPGLSRKNYYHFMVNSKNVQLDEKWNGLNEEKGWAGEWQSATALQPDGWTAEMKIPLSNFAMASDVASIWGLNLCRERKTVPEDTAWAATFGLFHSPDKFGTVRQFDADFAPYKIEVTAPALSYIFKDDRPLLECKQSFTNSSASARQVNVKICNISGKESASRDMMLLPGETQAITLPVSVKKDGSLYQFRTEIANASDGTRTYSASSVAESPALAQAYFDRSYYTNEKTANLICKLSINSVLPNISARIVLKPQAGKSMEKIVQVSGSSFNIPVSISSLPIGEYDANVAVMINGDTVYSENLRLIKYPATDHTVKIDTKNLCMLVDGKPFFPVGITGIPGIVIPEYAAAGFNITTDCSSDVAYYNGFMAIASTYHIISRDEYKSLALDVLDEKIRKSLPPAVMKYANHPAFSGYFWDEPQVNEVRGVKILSEVTRQLDPYHSIMPCFYHDTGPTIPASLYDLYIGDIYWHNVSDKYNLYRRRLIYHSGMAEKLRKPFWHMPNAAGWVARSAITPGQQRMQTYMGLICGAKGILYWTYDITYPAMRVELKKLAGEIRELSPVLTNQSPEQTVAGVDESEVYALAKVYNGDCYLLTANSSGNEEKVIRIKVSPAVAKSAKVLFENRTVAVVGGVLEDKFAPYATHVYVLQKTDTKKPIKIGIEKTASVNMPLPKIRRWPDFEEIQDGRVGNPGFEDEEDGQPRMWDASCGWEVPEYCALDTRESHESSKSLRLSIPQATRYAPETGFGWSADSKVTAFDLGKQRPACRYGHKVSNGLFKVDLPDGNYSVKVLASTSELFAIKGGIRQSLNIKTAEIPVPKGIENTIKENTFGVAVEGGQFALSMPSGSIYGLTITPKKAGNVRTFDFGPRNIPVTAGHKLVAASMLSRVSVISANGDSQPKIALKEGAKYKLCVYMKSDASKISVNFGMRKDAPWGPAESKTVSVGPEWAKYEMPITRNGEWVFAELGSPGTVWIDGFALEQN